MTRAYKPVLNRDKPLKFFAVDTVSPVKQRDRNLG
jgi:hypothetical protein